MQAGFWEKKGERVKSPLRVEMEFLLPRCQNNSALLRCWQWTLRTAQQNMARILARASREQQPHSSSPAAVEIQCVLLSPLSPLSIFFRIMVSHIPLESKKITGLFVIILRYLMSLVPKKQKTCLMGIYLVWNSVESRSVITWRRACLSLRTVTAEGGKPFPLLLLTVMAAAASGYRNMKSPLPLLSSV